VIRPKTTKNILLHPYWLIFSLSGVFFFFFAPNRGAMEYSIWFTGLLLFLHAAYGDYRIRSIPSYYAALVIICIALLLLSIIFSHEHSDTHRMYRVIKMLIIVFSIHLLSRKNVYKQITFVFGLLLTILIIGQFVARTVLGMPYGTYTNPHYLAQLASLALPFIFYFYYYRVVPGVYRFLLIPLGILDLDLLLRTSSRPAILALAFSMIFAIVVLVRGRRKWLGLLGLFFASLLLYVTKYANIIPRLENLILNISHEERVQFWTDTWKMLRHNSPWAWFIGNGIGSFPVFFPKYSIPKYNFLSFPHNHALQILFDNGLVGVVLVFGWQCFLLYLLISSSYKTYDSNLRFFTKCMTIVYLTCVIFSSLTFGFYSRFSLYPFAFITGVILVLAEKLSIGHVSNSMLKSGLEEADRGKPGLSKNP